MLVELGALDEAVSEASFLVIEELFLIKGDEAACMTLLHGGSSQFVLELVLELIAEDCEIVAFSLCFHLC